MEIDDDYDDDDDDDDDDGDCLQVDDVSEHLVPVNGF